MYLYKTKLGLDTKIFYVKCYGRMSIPMLITLVVGSVIQKASTKIGWGILGIKVLMIIGIYLLFMWHIAYNDDEKKMIKGLVNKIAHK